MFCLFLLITQLHTHCNLTHKQQIRPLAFRFYLMFGTIIWKVSCFVIFSLFFWVCPIEIVSGVHIPNMSANNWPSFHQKKCQVWPHLDNFICLCWFPSAILKINMGYIWIFICLYFSTEIRLAFQVETSTQ